jgi:hypothetical protein
MCLRCLDRIRCAIHGSAGQIRRLPEYGQPLASPNGSPRREPKGIRVAVRNRSILSAYASGFLRPGGFGGVGERFPNEGRREPVLLRAKRRAVEGVALHQAVERAAGNFRIAGRGRDVAVVPCE